MNESEMLQEVQNLISISNRIKNNWSDYTNGMKEIISDKYNHSTLAFRTLERMEAEAKFNLSDIIRQIEFVKDKIEIEIDLMLNVKHSESISEKIKNGKIRILKQQEQFELPITIACEKSNSLAVGVGGKRGKI